jgi:lipoprotein NlpI
MKSAFGSALPFMARNGFLVCGIINCVLAAEPPFPDAERARLMTELSERVTALDRAIEESPRDVALLSRRGDAHLFAGRFHAAVADFERMIMLDPAQDAPHWRLGIAYYFAGQFAKSARQFEKYHAFDDRDRENGIWKFLADIPVLGIEKARQRMLPYTRFDREPFPSLYALLGGSLTTDAFFAALESDRRASNPRVMFFAHYYAGLNEEILGRREKAVALIRQAVANRWGQTAEGGPAYMWQIARLHFEMLSLPTP